MKNMKHDKMKEHNHESMEDSEIRSWKRKLIGAWAFTIPVAIFMLLDRIFGINIFSYISGWD